MRRYGKRAVHPRQSIAVVEEGSEGRLWVQDLDWEQPRVIEGTEGAAWSFSSPDSAFIGFAVEGELRKIPVQGGPSSPICELPGASFVGGTWSPDGEVIVFSASSLGAPILYQVPAAGGTPIQVDLPAGEIVASGGTTDPNPNWGPHFLPSEAGSRVLAFTSGMPDEAKLVVLDVETGRGEILGPGALPFYSPSGHLVYQPTYGTNELWALPFSLNTLQATGEAFPFAENAWFPTVAGDGTLVYMSLTGSGQRQLVWRGRDGEKIAETGVVEEGILSPTLSPDESSIAYSATGAGGQDVWKYEIAQGTRTRLSTSSERDMRPVWSPDGAQVGFTSAKTYLHHIFVRNASGIGAEEALPATEDREFLSDWSQDSKCLLYHADSSQETVRDLWYLEHTEDGNGWAPHPFLQDPSPQIFPRLSPNGRYVAYLSNESGGWEVYVDSFPERGRRETVSSNGGTGVRWSRDGTELFYVEGTDTLMVVEVSTDGDFSATPPKSLFEHPSLNPNVESNYPPYDVSADGQRFLLAEPVGEETAERMIHIVQNWFAEFADRQ